MRSLTGSEDDVTRLFNPSSVAVIGASGRRHTLSWWPVELLRRNGFAGPIYPVNPTRADIDGLRCYPSIGSLPEAVDLVVVALDAPRSLEAVRECVDAGAKIVVLPTQGFAELGEEGRQREHALTSLAGPGGLRIVGTNTDGVGNIAAGAIASIQPLFGRGMTTGPVAVVTQSGAIAGSLLARLKHEGIGCRLYASTGNETDLGLVDFLSVMVQDADVRLVLSFVETLRRPEQFVEVTKLAAELGKPIVLIKVGRSAVGARRAAAHTGALAGSDQLYQALFDAYGVIRVSELSELVAVAKLHLTSGSPRSRTLGILSVSGGQAGAMADKATSMGLSVPSVSAAAEQALDSVLTFGKGFNPCDLTGEIATNPRLAAEVYTAFADEPGLGSIVYARKELTGTVGVEVAVRLVEAVRSRTAPPPLAVYAMDGSVDGGERDEFAAAGIPVFASLSDLFVAIDRLAWHYEFVVAKRWSNDVAAPSSNGRRASLEVGEAQKKQLLRQYGLRVPEEQLVMGVDEAVAAARAIGYPVVLKIVSERIPHKTEFGGVELDLRNADDVRAAYERLQENARRFLEGDVAEGVLVQEQIENGLEFIVGAEIDELLGPFVLVGFGGVMTEVFRDVAVHPAPVDAATAERMIARLRGAPLLNEFRGRAAVDREALVQTVVDMSRLAADCRDVLAEADLNPVFVLAAGDGVRVVDALLVPRA
jgi:acyl-CoA synthetase (NDP forming)